ncbi:MAG: dTMP kinase [Eubacteriales bacterium]
MDNQTKKGLFFALEGIDGSGKTTQAVLLAQILQQQGIPVCETREPTAGPVGSLLRQVLTGRMKADGRVVASLFAADRLDHLFNHTDGVLDQIEAGRTVVMDRYYFSSYAYHSVEVPMDWVVALNQQSSDALKPTATIFVDVTAETAMERIEANRLHTELYETRERLTAVREGYLRAFRRLQKEETVIIVDGNRSPEQVAQDIWNIVSVYYEG